MVRKAGNPESINNPVENLALLYEGIQQLNVGVSIYDARLLLVACNRRFLEMFDLPGEMAQTGKSLSSIWRLLAERGEFGPVDADDFVRKVADSLCGMQEPLVHELVRANGCYYEARATRLASGGYITIHTDISHRKQREAKLEARVRERTAELRRRESELIEEKELLKSVLENMQHGIAVVGKDLKLRVANRLLRDLLGFPEHLINPGTPFEELVRFNAQYGGYGQEEEEELVRRRMELASNPTPHLLDQVRNNQTVIEVRGDPMPNGGFITTYTDITERKAAEGQLRENAARLERYRDKQEEENILAQNIILRQMQRGSMNDPQLHYWFAPAAHFSGDVIAAARAADGRLYALLADATGHGLAAAISALPVLTVFHAMVRRSLRPRLILSELSKHLLESLPSGHFVATALLCIDEKRHTAEVWNGGIPDILLLDRDGSVQRVVGSSHLPLGIADASVDESMTVTTKLAWEAGSQFAMYSDGLLEAENPDGEPFGPQRLSAALVSVPLQQRLVAVQQAIQAHLGSGAAHDDISLLLIDCLEG